VNHLALEKINSAGDLNSFAPNRRIDLVSAQENITEDSPTTVPGLGSH
jgi:hypothetical protein